MTDTTISDAVVFPQDDGTGVSDGSEDYSSAAYFSALAKYQGYGSYVGEDNTGSATLQFNDIDTSNEQVDVGTGYAYIEEGSHTVQSGSQTTYDTTIPINTPYVVMLPSEVVNLGLGTDNVNDLWLAVDPTSNDDVFIRHGNGLSAPSVPSVKLGTVDTASGATTRANDLSTTSNKLVSAGERTVERLGGRGISNSLQSIPDSTVATVELDAIDQEDDATVLDVDISNNRIRVKKAGWVSISAAAKYDDTLGDGTEYRTRIAINGSTITEDISSTGTDTIGGAALTDAKDLSVDDDIELIVYQTSGSSKNLRATEDVSLVGIYEG
jgi:hypothetical protein